ncbi:hypothetical protein [Methanobacterium ferruginis]|uniref:hypothetical protein n=1 Tax=Methanobacterium ferruginis TaxID=710191 RepID=UPI002572E9D4|nr:hypothetical protein [Methanobacterium ferruginis]BDZ68781.1 hypothetical protein GCM10025860_22290 [Methanobacterium ferruginis]
MRLVTLNLQWGGEDRTDSILDYLIDLNADFLVVGEYQDNENGQKIRRLSRRKVSPTKQVVMIYWEF